MRERGRRCGAAPLRRSAAAFALDPMPIKTKRWNDPVAPDDGYRLLVCRYRPRGVRRQDETWGAWVPDLGPSRELHADFYGKDGPPIGWAKYRRRYLAEMKGQAEQIVELAGRAARENVTLLCSSACTDPQRCHRTLLAGLIGKRSTERRRARRARRERAR